MARAGVLLLALLLPAAVLAFKEHEFKVGSQEGCTFGLQAPLQARPDLTRRTKCACFMLSLVAEM